MKFALSLLVLVLSFPGLSQKVETYYDFYWKPCEPGMARFYSIIEKKDSGWLRYDYFVTGPSLQMKALFSDKDCKIKNGNAAYYYANGQLQAKGRFVKDKREGIYMRYYSNGMIADSASYLNDRPVGSRMMWFRTGYMSDSIYHVNDSMDVQVTWFDGGTPAGAGYVLNGKQHGMWKYYHENNKLAGEVIYNRGTEISKSYFNEDGSPQPDTAKGNKAARFKKGDAKGWSEYLSKKIYWPLNLKLVNTNQVTIGVEFIISAEGKVQDAEVIVPFSKEFNEIALDVILKSPDWYPALQHNRRVPQRFRQSLTFQQE